MAKRPSTGFQRGRLFTWAIYFVDGARKNSPFQFEAFLAYWLSYFVFPGPPEDGLHASVFPMAVLASPREEVGLSAMVFGLSIRPS